MTLYTKKGDDGTTTLFGSKDRISKFSPETEALGTLDELNAVIGICRAKFDETDIRVRDQRASEVLFDVQQHLFTIQAELAGADKTITADKVDWLGDTVDHIESTLEPITSFLLPGASELSSFVDLSRTVARRAERRVVEVQQTSEMKLGDNTVAYMNRLSSLLYALVRLTNDVVGGEEEAPTYN